MSTILHRQNNLQMLVTKKNIILLVALLKDITVITVFSAPSDKCNIKVIIQYIPCVHLTLLLQSVHGFKSDIKFFDNELHVLSFATYSSYPLSSL